MRGMRQLLVLCVLLPSLVGRYEIEGLVLAGVHLFNYYREVAGLARGIYGLLVGKEEGHP